jgi:hypothetical protein
LLHYAPITCGGGEKECQRKRKTGKKKSGKKRKNGKRKSGKF